jgi:arylsulfatase A-like enzyme
LTKQRRILIGGAVLLLAGAIVWWAQRNDETAGAQDAARRRDVPVIIYVVASDSVVFEQAYAPAPWTTPSVASLITSTFVCEHQMTQRKTLAPELKTLAERLKTVGFGTGAFIANPLAGGLTDLNRGYVDYRPGSRCR